MIAASQAQSQLRVTGESDAESEKFWWSYKRTRSPNSGMRVWGKEMEARLKGISSSSEEGMPSPASGRQVEPVVLFVEESESKEWVAQGWVFFFLIWEGQG